MAKKPDDTTRIAIMVFFSGVIGIHVYDCVCKGLRFMLM